MIRQSNTFSRHAVRYLAGFSLIVLLAAFLAPQAFAAKPCWDEDHNKISCEPIGNNVGPGPDTYAGLSGEILDSSLRFCESEANPLDIRGNYNCSEEDIGICVVGLGEAVASRKNRAALCGVLRLDSGHLPLSVDSYVYGWTDSCDNGECGLEVRIQSSDPLIEVITFGKSKAIEVILFADATGLDDTPFPFDETVDLDVHAVEIDFKKTGSTRSYVICNYDVLSAPGWVSLHGEPD